ncbi:MAG TPA: hypothetical protein VF677_03945 [Flavobacterium sp.]|jgi:hypothetical protein
MKTLNFYYILFLLLFSFCSISAQAKKDTVGCNIKQNDLRIEGELFASASPIFLRVYNEEFEYGVIQLGKRKGEIFLYFKIFTENVCVKQKQPLELYFEGGEMYILKNRFAVNCEGIAIVQLTNTDIKKIKKNNIAKIKLFTLKRDYEFSPTDVDNSNLKNYLDCLKSYKVRKKTK